MAKSAVIVALATLSLVVAEEMTLNVNLKKPMAVVSDKFLSITLDPVVLFNSDSLSDMERSTSMAKALAPAYVRIAGPRSNSYIFERGLYSQESNTDPGYTFTESHWMQVNQWAGRSGLEVVASLAPQQADPSNSGNRNLNWDPRNALDLISFSDHMAYNSSWQLGYECQTQCDLTGVEMGRYVQRLRNMLDAFPRYAENGLLVGPDVVSWKTRQQQQYLQDFFSSATGSLSAVTWHPDFAGVTLETDGVSMHQDDLNLDKDSLFRVVGRFIYKKPLWLAESKPEECKRQFLGALVWARRLGNAAKLGAQVIMRQPDNSNLFRPTPDYWVSVIHKMLVGREVLDARVFMGNRTHVHFFAHCTRPSAKYEAGSLTVFGINLTPSKITTSLKGIKPKLVHKYVLLPGFDATNRMFAETVLLNNELLNLVNGKEVPDIQPVISNSDNGVKLKLPSGGIGFWVLPGLKIKSCMGQDDDNNPERNLIKKSSKHMEELSVEVESEPEIEDSQEISEASIEEKKLSPRVIKQATHQKRQLLRRTSRHSRDEERDEQTERKPSHSKTEIPKHDLDKSDKIVRKKERHSIEVKDSEKPTMNSKNNEKNSSSEESFIKTVHQKPKVGTNPRPKVPGTRKRQTDEINKKPMEIRPRTVKSHLHKDEKEDPAEKKSMSTEKVIQALTLITKVENAMKDLGKDIAAVSFGSNFASDVTSGLSQSSNSGAAADDDELLDEVLHTEKSKRTSIPEKIEDQLKALYNLLSEKKEKRTNPLAHRQRRDLDKSASENPLGFRPKDSIIIRSRTRAEAMKTKRQERLQELKQRIREKQELRKEHKKEMMPHESEEEEFYGFAHNEVPSYFPRDDIYYPTNADLDKNSQPHDIHATVAKDDIWSAEKENDHMPHEFYESIKVQQSDFKKAGEAEQVRETEKNIKPAEIKTETLNYETTTKSQLEYEDTKPNENNVQQSYYYQPNSNNEYNRPYDYKTDTRTQSEYQPAYHTYEKKNDYASYQPTYQQQNPTYQYAYQNHQNYPTTYQRIKRQANNIEDILHMEMVAQDDNNLKDCQCRVIRGVPVCQDCIMKQYQNANSMYGVPLLMQSNVPYMQTNRYTDYYDEEMSKRRRRNLKENNADAKKSEVVINPEVLNQESEFEAIENPTLQKSTSPKIKNDEITKKKFEKSPQAQVSESSQSQSQELQEKSQDKQAESKINTSKSNREESKMNSQKKQEIQKLSLSQDSNIEKNDQDLKNEEAQEAMILTAQGKDVSTKKTQNQDSVDLSPAEEGIENSSDVARTDKIQIDGPVLSDQETSSVTSTVPTSSSTEDTLNPESQSEKIKSNRLPRKIENPPTKFFLYQKDNVTDPPPRRDNKGTAQANKKSSKSVAQEHSGTFSANTEARPIARPPFERETSSGRVTKTRPGSDSGSQISSSRSEFTTESAHSQTTNYSETTGSSKVSNNPQSTAETKNASKTTSNSQSTKNESKNFKSKSRDNSQTTSENNSSSKTDSNTKTKNEKRYSQSNIDPKHSNRSKTYSGSQSSNSGSESKNIDNSKTDIESQSNSEKKSRSVSSSPEKKENDEIKETVSNAPDENKESKEASASDSSVTTESSTNTKPAASENPKKDAGAEGKDKSKISNTKSDEQSKLRQARLLIRAEALAALKKENENRRAKKMIENSMKLLETENAKFEEYQRRKRDQLEKLKMRLRAKREKMLHQYRDELLEVVNEDIATENRHSRDTQPDVPKKNQEAASPSKPPNNPRHLPVQSLAKTDNRAKKQNRKPNVKQISKRENKRISSFEEDDVPNASDSQEYQSSNQKRSYDSDENDRLSKRQIPGDYNDYYSQRDYVQYAEPQDHQGYVRYIEQPEEQIIQGEQTYEDQLSENYQDQHPQSVQEENTDTIPMKVNYAPDEFAEVGLRNEPEADTDYEEAPEGQNNEDNFEVDSNEKNYQKSKRSNMRMLEHEPSFYEEDETSFEREFYSLPSSRYYRRTYRHDPYAYSNRRLRRDIAQNRGENIDGPLSFSLSFEKSKMQRKKNGVIADESTRKKRATDRNPKNANSASSTQSTMNKNVKKFYKNVSIQKKNQKLRNNLREPSVIRSNPQKRSLKNTINPKFISNNEIDRSDLEMDKVLDNIVEMKQDQELLEEFDRQKSKLIQNYRENRHSLNKLLNTNVENATEKMNNTTQPNIESIISDTIPKIETVFTGNMKKAQNFTENVEEFIENFDDDESDESLVTDKPKRNGKKLEITSYADDGKWSSHIFFSTVGKVKKIFDIVSNFAKIFRNHD